MLAVGIDWSEEFHLVALGRPADDPYWTAPALPWTMRRAYGGQDFAKDYPVSY